VAPGNQRAIRGEHRLECRCWRSRGIPVGAAGPRSPAARPGRVDECAALIRCAGVAGRVGCPLPVQWSKASSAVSSNGAMRSVPSLPSGTFSRPPASSTAAGRQREPRHRSSTRPAHRTRTPAGRCLSRPPPATPTRPAAAQRGRTALGLTAAPVPCETIPWTDSVRRAGVRNSTTCDGPGNRTTGNRCIGRAAASGDPGPGPGPRVSDGGCLGGQWCASRGLCSARSNSRAYSRP